MCCFLYLTKIHQNMLISSNECKPLTFILHFSERTLTLLKSEVIPSLRSSLCGLESQKQANGSADRSIDGSSRPFFKLSSSLECFNAQSGWKPISFTQTNFFLSKMKRNLNIGLQQNSPGAAINHVAGWAWRGAVSEGNLNSKTESATTDYTQQNRL